MLIETLDPRAARRLRQGHADASLMPLVETMPEPPSPPQPKPHTGADHARQSLLAVLGVYVVLALVALVQGALSGTFGNLDPSFVAVLAVLSPVLAVGAKDFLHWMSTGDWQVPTASRGFRR